MFPCMETTHKATRDREMTKLRQGDVLFRCSVLHSEIRECPENTLLADSLRSSFRGIVYGVYTQDPPVILDLIIGSPGQELRYFRPTIAHPRPCFRHDSLLLGAPRVLLDGRICGA